MIATLLVWVVSACAGSRGKPDHYARAVDAQRECCEHLDGPGRAACLEQIVTIPDDQSDVTSSPANQATFACVREHFTCDPQTGQATLESKQAQLDCINDLSTAMNE